jgi:hypothetical protein
MDGFDESSNRVVSHKGVGSKRLSKRWKHLKEQSSSATKYLYTEAVGIKASGSNGYSV